MPRSIKAEEPLSYNEHIRPILVENCFSCHGADSASRKADLRLDRRDDAIEYGAIVAGDSDSTLIILGTTKAEKGRSPEAKS